jgi:hypothetical protein
MRTNTLRRKAFKSKMRVNFKRGEVKKHYSQMTDLEKDFLMRKFFAIPKQEWRFTDYSKARFEQRNIDPQHFLTLWQNPELIEYHKKDGTNRILLRSQFQKDEMEVCAVFDLTNKVIVTVWLNWMNNQHQNLVIEMYDQRVDILGEF